MNRPITVSVLLVAILFVSSIVGTLLYYDGAVNEKNSKIFLLNDEITNLNSQISNLKGQVRNLTSPNLVTALRIKDIQYGPPVKPKAEFEFDGTSVKTFYYLFIWGSVRNTGVV